jgi:transposase-like protein
LCYACIAPETHAAGAALTPLVGDTLWERTATSRTASLAAWGTGKTVEPQRPTEEKTMARHYTAEEKLRALDSLSANLDDILATSIETGIPEATLRRWRRQYMPDYESALQMRKLRQTLIKEALDLASHIKQVIEEAPLNQRATALNHMVDKILKITQLLEVKTDEPETTQPALRIEFVDEQGELHDTPYWAERDTDQ